MTKTCMGCLNYHRIKLRGQWFSECDAGKGTKWGAPMRPCSAFRPRFTWEEEQEQIRESMEDCLL